MTNQEIKKLYERLKAEYIQRFKRGESLGLCIVISFMKLASELDYEERAILKADLKKFRDTQRYSYEHVRRGNGEDEFVKVSNKNIDYGHSFAWHPDDVESRIAYLDAMIKIYEKS